MKRDEITRFLPQKPPFLFVDEVLSQKDEPRSITTRLFLDPKMSIFASHFPGNPIFPGVYLIEFAAQSVLLIFAHLTNDKSQNVSNNQRGKEHLLISIEKFRFYKKCLPSETLITEATLVDDALGMYKAEVKIMNENSGEMVAKGIIVVN